jgi:hypothetical protein
MHQALQGFAQECKSRISRPVSFLCIAVRCTVLRSRWYQSGIKPHLSERCFQRRVPDSETLHSEARAWQLRRDAAGTSIDWRFGTNDARIKLKRLYPSFQE